MQHCFLAQDTLGRGSHGVEGEEVRLLYAVLLLDECEARAQLPRERVLKPRHAILFTDGGIPKYIDKTIM